MENDLRLIGEAPETNKFPYASHINPFPGPTIHKDVSNDQLFELLCDNYQYRSLNRSVGWAVLQK